MRITPDAVRVLFSYLKDVEGLKLNVPALLLEHGHHELQVLRITDVLLHDGEVVSVEKQLTQQLETLSPRHVVVGVEQALVISEHGLVVRLQKLCAQGLVLRQQLLLTE